MKIYSEKIGPVEYFGGIAFLCFAIPYAWRVPRLWPLCIVFSVCALWSLRRVVKKNEDVLREAKPDDNRVGKIVFLCGALIVGNALLIRFL
jgi:hypothetical protein